MAPQYWSPPIGAIVARGTSPPFFAYMSYTLSTPILSVTVRAVTCEPRPNAVE